MEVVGISKTYGSVTAVSDISFSIEGGQYFVLLGPSGGGKTTLLRLIGGFIRPSAGEVYLHGRPAGHLPPNRRPTSMVFQGYALFPHMSVERNVAYGLKLRRLPKEEIREKVDRMLAMVGLVGLNRRMPHELSGGQQQRVQLARSLVLDTDILLLDEPLAALDAKLRKEMCLELKHIQKEVGITFLHVTHNQEEAMTIADHIAIIADGGLVELGAPHEIYATPRARFTAEFIGEKNLLEGRVTGTDGDHAVVDLGHAAVRVPAPDGSPAVGAEVSLSISSERATLANGSPGETECLSGRYVERVYLGLTYNDVVQIGDGEDFVVRSLVTDGAPEPTPGEEVTVSWKRADARLHTF